MLKTKKYIVSLFFILFFNCFLSQTGNYFSKNYFPKEYGSGANNFGITQDNDGLIYIANDNGILIFDGYNWKICRRFDEVTITAINKTTEGKIFFGTKNGDFGYIEKTKRGNFIYVSLRKNLQEKDRPNNDIKQILSINNTVYFLSSDKLVQFKNGVYKTFFPKNSFHIRGFVLGMHVFVTDINNQIFFIKNDKLIGVNNTEKLSCEKNFFFYPAPLNKNYIGFRNVGIYKVKYDSLSPENTSFERQKAACEASISNEEINNGTLLKNGNFIITTNKAGAIEINSDLEVVKSFNTKNYINDNNVKFAFQDINGNLWFALYYGISYIESNSRVFKYDRTNGINGPVQCAAYYRNCLYIATDKGVQFFNTKSNSFEELLEFNKQCWFLLNYQNNLFICSQKGLFIFNGTTISQISPNKSSFLYPDPSKKDIIYSATENGIDIYLINDTKINLLKSIALYAPINSITGDMFHNIYFGAANGKIYFIKNNDKLSLDSINTTEIISNQTNENYLFSYKKKTLIGTSDGIYAITKKGEKFVFIKDTLFHEFTKETEIFRASENDDDLFCSQTKENKTQNRIEKQIIYITKNNNKFFINRNETGRLKDIKANFIAYDSSKKIILISSDEGLFIFNKQIKLINPKYNLYFKSIAFNKDTLYENLFLDKLDKQNIIDYTNNDLKITIGYNYFENINDVEFSYYLEGKENTYGVRTKKFDINYSNLNEGNYTFYIRAFNNSDSNFIEKSFSFKILPPWYRTILALCVYLLLFIITIVIIIKLYAKRLKSQNIKLEEIIKQRTLTIKDQVLLLENQKKEIIDSINYAKRIQKSLLASDKLLKKYLKDYFIFFKPKDIVSGDFYWATILENGNFLFITADSTGHGVPGALMSMLNISCLEKATVSEKLTKPNEILNSIRKKIIETLANDGSSDGGKDGMDCSLLCFDKNKLTISAANNPVWILRKDDNNNNFIIEIKPDKMPVGKHEKQNEPFKLHEIKLVENDIIYTITDGFSDQFGGEKGKKFMTKKLQYLILENADLPMDAQLRVIENAFYSWKGNLDQVDDVTIIGIKI